MANDLCFLILLLLGIVCQGITEYLNRFVLNTMDELPSRSQPVNPSHVTLNGLSHYYPHNASVNNSISGHAEASVNHLELGQHTLQKQQLY